MGSIGDMVGGMTSTQILVGLVAFIMLAGSLGFNAYWHAKKESEIPCLSCLGLDPVSETFDGEWWTSYPSSYDKAGQPVSHPDFVKSKFNRYSVVLVFLWKDPCSGCVQQWESMSDAGLVSGGEEDGKMAKYVSNVALLSLDVNTETGRTAFDTYGKIKGFEGTPTTAFIIELPDGGYGWFGYVGPMDGADVDAILQFGMQHH